MQIDNLNELPKEKRPPENLIWSGTERDLDNWIERVVRGKEDTKINLLIEDVEG